MNSRQGAKAPRREPDPRLDEWARKVIGACIEVHRILGPGYLESIYEKALEVEFKLRGIPFERQKHLPVTYKGHKLHEGRVDFFVAGCLPVEIKASDDAPVFRAIVISYLKAAGCERGLLINFQVEVLRDGIRRVVRT